MKYVLLLLTFTFLSSFSALANNEIESLYQAISGVEQEMNRLTERRIHLHSQVGKYRFDDLAYESNYIFKELKSLERKKTELTTALISKMQKVGEL